RWHTQPLDRRHREGLAGWRLVGQSIEDKQARAEKRDTRERHGTPGHVTRRRRAIEVEAERFIEIVASHPLCFVGLAFDPPTGPGRESKTRRRIVMLRAGPVELDCEIARRSRAKS